ncbi:MAG: galactose mutarotase [Lentisphaerales bacterium]|nr:galactose mutarotase [Lentisphaerales bacterium]
MNLYTLKNSNGLEAKITDYGGIVTSLSVPDTNGALEDVVAGYNNLEYYVEANPYFGCLVGRFGNRIAKGKFSIDGKEYILAQNNGENNLHGGLKGFDKVLWSAVEKQTSEGPSLELTYTSKDGEEGFPGNLQVKAIYTLTKANELKLAFTATTDKKTHVNLTHHSYFNLAGPESGNIYDHEVMINADKFTPVDETLIPTGELKAVKGTPFDFTQPKKIGARINSNDQQLKYGLGYDHNWVINDTSSNELNFMARVTEPTTGRVMEVYSDKPGMQFYLGNFLDSSNIGKGGKAYKHRYAFCMEPQSFPDSPNQPTFPSTLLSPGEVYNHTIIYKFSVK